MSYGSNCLFQLISYNINNIHVIDIIDQTTEYDTCVNLSPLSGTFGISREICFRSSQSVTDSLYSFIAFVKIFKFE